MKTKTKTLTECSVLIALATILSVIIIFHLPYGGSITLCSMLPIIIIGFRHGFKWGLLSGSVYGILQMFLGVAQGDFKGADIATVIGMIVLDYILAFMVLGLAGMFKNKIKSQPLAFSLGSLVVCVLRYIIHCISGYIFFRSYAEWFFSQEGFTLGADILTKYTGVSLSVIYTTVYNAMYMLPETIITLVVGFLLITLVKKIGNPNEKM